MATIYNWDCKTVDVYPTEGDYTDVVYNVYWKVTGVSDQLDSEGKPYEYTINNTQLIPLNSQSEFIPFNDLTNEIVVSWTKEAMGEEVVEGIESTIQYYIDLEINPTSVTMTVAD
jgi:hypothetical protein